MVAENVLVESTAPNGGTGHLVIRNAHAKHGYDVELGDSSPDLFLESGPKRVLRRMSRAASAKQTTINPTPTTKTPSPAGATTIS
jgi:hypothetical protein